MMKKSRKQVQAKKGGRTEKKKEFSKKKQEIRSYEEFAESYMSVKKDQNQEIRMISK